MTHTSLTYDSRTTSWLQHAGIRRWELPAFDGDPGRLAFSPDLVFLTRHPDIRNREGAVEAVLQHHLDVFTGFTEQLELGLITPFSLRLRLGEVPFKVPAALAADAGRVAMDEVWHADTARDLRGANQTAAVRLIPPFLALLRATQKGMSHRARILNCGVFTAVSETMITGTLNQVPRDARVRLDVREALKEHAREEAFHHGIFGQMIGTLWSQLAPEDQNLLGPLWGAAISAFLRPDTTAQAMGLRCLGFAPEDARRIAAEAAEDEADRVRLRQASAATVRFLERYGVLDHDQSRRGLEAAGLID